MTVSGNALQVGSYSVTYTARDKAGNIATATRIVKVVSPCTGAEHFCPATCRCTPDRHACVLHAVLLASCVALFVLP